MKKIFFMVLLLACVVTVQAERKFSERPKLVVGIVVDQMRWDYLGRYYDQFTDDGFKRMIDEGFSCDNCLINYLPTVTAIGHTSAYTGSTPAFHGICGNDFVIDGEKVYCCGDKSVEPVGTDNKRRGQMSPKNLLATTIGDQLRLHTDFRSKVVGVSYKDRAAILPAGHSANAAYWLDYNNGQFITSTYYMEQLPKWAADFNKRLRKDKQYQGFRDMGSRIGYSPICGNVTADMAIAALQGENLGRGEDTDMLCVSFSQTDVIGHEWSTRGVKTDSAYLELDKDIARLLKACDEQVGEGNYIVFLTADHGAAHNASFMEQHKMNGGSWEYDEKMRPGLEAHLKEAFKTDRNLVQATMAYRIFLDHKLIDSLGLDLQRVKDEAIRYMKQQQNVCFVIDYEKAASQPVPQILRERALMGYHYRRSGDILVIPEPGYYEVGKWSSPVGTTHGEWNPYDAHIPLLFFGWQVKHGSLSREVHITDIAPTITQMLHIQQPNACVGEAIVEISK